MAVGRGKNFVEQAPCLMGWRVGGRQQPQVVSEGQHPPGQQLYSNNVQLTYPREHTEAQDEKRHAHQRSASGRRHFWQSPKPESLPGSAPIYLGSSKALNQNTSNAHIKIPYATTPFSPSLAGHVGVVERTCSGGDTPAESAS